MFSVVYQISLINKTISIDFNYFCFYFGLLQPSYELLREDYLLSVLECLDMLTTINYMDFQL